MGPFGIGQAVRDSRTAALAGAGAGFLGDVNLPGQAHAVVLRSVHAHARIRAVDASAALRAPGVLAVFTGTDLAEAGLGTMPTTLLARGRTARPCSRRPTRSWARPRPVRGRSRRPAGRRDAAQAEDAAELVRIDYEPLPSVTATDEAARPGSPPVWDECPDNVSNVFETGDRGGHRYGASRGPITSSAAATSSPGSTPSSWSPGARSASTTREDRYTLYADVQYPTACATPWPPASSRSRAPDPRRRRRHRRCLRDQGLAVSRAPAGAVGGPQAGATGRWTCERREAILADEHARDTVSEAELALDAGAGSSGSASGPSRTWAPTSRRTGTCSPPSATSSRWSASTRSRGLRPRDQRPGQRELDGAVSRGRAGPSRPTSSSGSSTTPPASSAGTRSSSGGRISSRLGHAVQEPARRDLRLRRFRAEHGQGARPRRRRRVRRPATRRPGVEGRCAAWARQRHRAGGGASPSSPRSASTRAGAPPS